MGDAGAVSKSFRQLRCPPRELLLHLTLLQVLGSRTLLVVLIPIDCLI